MVSDSMGPAGMMNARFAKTRELLYELKVSDIIGPTVITTRPDQMMSELRAVLRDHRISGTPVVEDGRLVGIISIEDLVHWLSSGGQDCPIRERMNCRPEVLHADQPLVQAVSRFEQTGFGRLPVLDPQDHRVVGIVTKGRIIEALLGKLDRALQEEEIRQYRASHIFEDIVAEYKEIYLTYEIVGRDFERAGTASTQMKRNLKRLGIRPDTIHRVAIASYEAEMNTVIYTDGGIMEYRITPDEILVRVRDQGPGIADVQKAMEPGYSTAPDWVRELGFGAGMGIPNIKRCSDRMALDSTPGVGTTLTIRFFARKEDEAAGDR